MDTRIVSIGVYQKRSSAKNTLGKLTGNFYENETKITPQTHIPKFEIFHFLDNISKIKIDQNRFCSEK